MGIGFSGFVSESSTVGAPTPSKPGLEDIPENCVALVLTHLDPPEICKLARLNRVFRQASSADFVWESKLPENYASLVKKLLDQSPQSLTKKKDIYARLCRPTRFDGVSKEVWMEKSDGGICISISWKGMKITGINDRRYWNHLSTDESRFHNIAYLQQIWWLEVEGNLEFELPRGTYSLYFRLHLGRATTTTTIKRHDRRVCNHDQVHGWDLKPVRFQFSTSNGQSAMSQYYLKEPRKWINYQVGDFVVEKPDSTTKIKFSMTQIDCTHPKGGLCLDSVMILPKRVLMEEEVKAAF